MIKRIIFDMDDTLMSFPKDYKSGYQDVIDKYNLNITPTDLYSIIDIYQDCGKYDYLDQDKLLGLLNKELNLNLGIDFMESFFDMFDKLITEIPDSIKETLQYLSNKYELVILTNWFTSSQVNRLKLAGICSYFKEVYGSDIVKMKPMKDAFLLSCGKYDVNECLMVGDNLEIDIKVPYEMGMNVYYLNKEVDKKYPTIKSIEELKEML